MADHFCEVASREGFGEKIDAFLERKVLADNFNAIAAHVSHSNLRIVHDDDLSQFFSRHLPWHHQVGVDLLRKSGEFFVMKEDLDDQAEAANEGI